MYCKPTGVEPKLLPSSCYHPIYFYILYIKQYQRPDDQIIRGAKYAGRFERGIKGRVMLEQENRDKHRTGKGIYVLTFLLAVGVVISFILTQSEHFRSYFDGDPALTQSSVVEKTDAEDQHDLRLNAYTYADFEKPVLGEAIKKQKLDVCEIPVSVLVLNTEEGIFKSEWTKKVQAIKYSGIAYYMTDLSKMQASDIQIDQDKRLITLMIPDPVLDHIDIDSDQTEVLTAKNGILAFGRNVMTVDENSALESRAQAEMEAELEKTGVLQQAEKIAKLSVHEIFESVIQKVSAEYQLEVKLRSEGN